MRLTSIIHSFLKEVFRRSCDSRWCPRSTQMPCWMKRSRTIEKNRREVSRGQRQPRAREPSSRPRTHPLLPEYQQEAMLRKPEVIPLTLRPRLMDNLNLKQWTRYHLVLPVSLTQWILTRVVAARRRAENDKYITWANELWLINVFT